MRVINASLDDPIARISDHIIGTLASMVMFEVSLLSLCIDYEVWALLIKVLGDVRKQRRSYGAPTGTQTACRPPQCNSWTRYVLAGSTLDRSVGIPF